MSINFFLKSNVKYKDFNIPVIYMNQDFIEGDELIISFEAYVKHYKQNNFFETLVKRNTEEIEPFVNIKDKSKLFIRDFQNRYYLMRHKSWTIKFYRKII